jgi:hypothetical protein
MIKLVKNNSVKLIDKESGLIQMLLSDGWVAENQEGEYKQEQPKRTTGRKK